jgi:hypothetical protein
VLVNIGTKDEVVFNGKDAGEPAAMGVMSICK